MIKNIIENRNYHYELILRKPDKTSVAFIVYENLNFTRNFNDSSSLSFSTPKYFYNQKTGENYINPVWEQIKQGWIVELQAWDSNYIESGQIVDETVTYPKRLVYDEYFTVEQPDLSASADSNNKSINCVSRYQTIFNKVKLRGFDDTRKLFDCQFNSNMDVVLDQDGYPIPISYSVSDFTQGGIINYILENILTGWRVAYYDKNLINIGQPAVVPTYDIDFFTGNVSYATDSENHEILVTGLSTYWTSGGDGYDLWSDVLSTNTSINPILLYLDGTEKDAEQYIASVNNLMQVVDIPTMLSLANVNAIMAEPLKGLELMNKATTMLSEMRGYLTDLYSYKYSSDEVGTSGIFPQEVETYIASVDELCEKILDNFYSSLFYVYGTATGKFPYRTLKFDNSNLTDVFKSLQESFLCVFEFDSKNQLIYIYGRDNSAVDKDQTLIISPDNYMTDIQYQAKTDQVVTRLYVAGKDNLWCTDYNPTGQRYVDDFSYFTQDSTSGMSAELTVALTRYNAYVSAHQDDLIDVTVYYYNSTNNSYPTSAVHMKADKIVNKIAKFSTQVAEAQQIARAFWLAEGEQSVNSDLDDTEDANTKITPAQIEAVNLTLDNLNAQFTQIVDFKLPGSGQANLRRVWMPEYDKPNEATTDPNTTSSFYLYVNMYNYQQALLNWQEQFLYENATDSQGKIFTDELLAELANYVYEEDITFENITDGKTLYNYAKDYLQYINNIPVSINIGLVDILSNYQYQMDWSKITDVGAKIHIEFKDFNLTLNNSVFKIMNYTHSISPNSQDLAITLSNNYELQNDYNKNLIDVWAESYKQVQDINTYRKTWEDFIAKQEQMLLQGQQIRADVNSIVDSAGKTIIDGKGLVLSKSGANTLRPNADGMYSRDKSIASTKAGTGYVANEQLFPDHVVFQDADMSYSTGTDGTTTLTVAGVGGGSGGGTTGLPRYYTAPFCSQKLQALDVRNGTSYITTNESGQSCIYYMETDINSTSGGKFHYYMAVLTASTDASAVNGFATVQFTDNAGRNMYYAVNNNVVDYNTLVYTTTTAPVMIYAATLTPTFEIIRSTNHVPDIIFGIGNGTGDQEKWKFIKDPYGGRFVYEDTNGLEQGIFMGVRTVDNIEEFGTYLIVDGVKVRAFGGEIFESYADAVAATANMPNNTIGVYKM